MRYPHLFFQKDGSFCGRWSIILIYVMWIDQEEDDIRFLGFVNRVLLHHDVGCLHKFRLVWSPMSISSPVTSWIHTAISKNLHELILHQSLYYKERPSVVPFVIPMSVLTCDTLRFLELDGFISVSESIAVYLPKLETIMLDSIHFQSQEAFEKLISGCPMLTNLHISITEDMTTDDDFTYVISSTSLRRLEIVVAYPGDVPLYIHLVLEAPSIEYLSLEGFIPVFLVKKSLSSLNEAKLDADFGECNIFDVDVNMCNSVVEAVRVFECAKTLNLSQHIIWAISCATICLSTEFKRLVKLEAVTFSCACSSLRDFIECSDNLEVLSVHQYDSCSGYIVFDTSKWIAPVQVPRCLSNSLKNVVLKGYYGLKNEREMVRYMLEHGKALEDMEISFDGSSSELDNAKSELVQEIGELSKKLSNKFHVYDVKFSGETSKCNIKVLKPPPSPQKSQLCESLEL